MAHDNLEGRSASGEYGALNLKKRYDNFIGGA